MNEGGAGPVEQIFDFPKLTLGFACDADQRTLGAGAFYDINNMMPGEGALRRRPAVTPHQTFLSGIVWAGYLLPTPKTERIVNLFQFQTYGLTSTYILVTDRAFYWRSTTGAWQELTPMTTGTCNITGGTTALAGIGTVWRSVDAVTTNMMVQLSGNYYGIASVNSDTSITLSSVYPGPNLAGGAFAIKRNWLLQNTLAGGIATRDHVWAVALNGDVYICGNIGSDLNTAISPNPIQAGAVLKVANAALYGLVGLAQATVIVAGSKASGPGPPAALGYTWTPYGFDVLEDGRLVIAASWIQSVTSSGAARFIYSSHLNVTVWTVTPAGFTDIQKNGMVSGMCRLGRSRAIHFDTGIVVAEPTGQADPPMSFADSRARVGSISGHAIVDVPEAGGQLYVGDDGNLRVFDGSTDRIVDPQFLRLTTLKESIAAELPIVGGGSFRTSFKYAQAAYLPHRGQFVVLYCVDYGAPASSLGSRSLMAVYDIKHGFSYYWTVGSEVTMIGTGWTGTAAYVPGITNALFGANMEFVYGGPNIDDTVSSVLYPFGTMNPLAFEDTQAPTFGASSLQDGNSGGCFFVTDALDMDAPGVIKAITRVELVGETMRGQTAAGTYVSAEILSPYGVVVGAVNEILGPSAFNAGSRAIMFTFAAVGAFDAYRIRIRMRDPDSLRIATPMRFKLLKMRVFWVPVGDQRAGIP